MIPQDGQPECPNVFDGAALVHLLPTVSVTTFDEYADSIFIPHLVRQLENCSWLDLVWDTYITDSIKASTRERQGQGIRRKVAGKNKVPTNWKSFLRDERNKEELFKFLSGKVISFKYPDNKEVFVTDGPFVLTNSTTQSMQQCNHEEVDMRLVIHLIDARKD